MHPPMNNNGLKFESEHKMMMVYEELKVRTWTTTLSLLSRLLPNLLHGPCQKRERGELAVIAFGARRGNISSHTGKAHKTHYTPVTLFPSTAFLHFSLSRPRGDA